MGKLRHIAIQVPDLEKAAAFYEGVFGLKRLKKVDAPIGNAISLSDGVMNLTLLHFPEGTMGGKGGPDWAGLHHFGFVVENETVTEQAISRPPNCSCTQNHPSPTRNGEVSRAVRRRRPTSLVCRLRTHGTT